MFKFISLAFLLALFFDVRADISTIQPYLIDTHLQALGSTIEDLPLEYRKSLKLVRIPDHDPETYKWAARFDADPINHFYFEIAKNNMLASASFFENPNFFTSQETKAGDNYCQVLESYPDLKLHGFSGRYGIYLYATEKSNRMVFAFESNGIDLQKLIDREQKITNNEICQFKLFAITIYNNPVE